MALKDLLAEQKSCPRCNICKWIPVEKYKRAETGAGCPALEKYQFHAYSAGGKQHMSIGLTEEVIPWDESAADVTYKCLMCGACEFACKVYRPDMDVTETFEELRNTCVEKGLLPDSMKNMMNLLKENDDCLGRTSKDRIDWAVKADAKLLSADQSGDVFLFAGNAALYDEKLADKTAKISRFLIDKGYDIITAGTSEYNSGYEAFVLGDIETGIACGKRVCEQIKASGADTIIVMDAHSFGTMRYYYPKYGLELKAEVKHITQVLAEMIESGKLTFTKSFNKTVTYQDPCYLGRRSDPYKPPFPGPKDMRPVSASRSGQLGIYDEPRTIINAVPGVHLEEMDRRRSYAWCCGGGAGTEQTYPELTENTAKERIKEADLTGADVLITACPNCQHVLSRASEGIEVMDILDLVLEKGGAE